MREQLTDSNPSRVTLEKTAKKNYDKCKLRAFGEKPYFTELHACMYIRYESEKSTLKSS